MLPDFKRNPVALQPRHIMGSVAPPYVPSLTPAERTRRALYNLRLRTLRDPLLETFNKPNPDLSCERRDATTVTPQALTLFNSRFAHVGIHFDKLGREIPKQFEHVLCYQNLPIAFRSCAYADRRNIDFACDSLSEV